jgi:hypothetical protein
MFILPAKLSKLNFFMNSGKVRQLGNHEERRSQKFFLSQCKYCIELGTTNGACSFISSGYCFYIFIIRDQITQNINGFMNC